MANSSSLGRILPLLLLLKCTACDQIGLTPSPSTTAPLLSPTATPSPTAISTPTIPLKEARVEELLAAMTIEEKVGQLFVVYFAEPYFSPALEEMITQYNVGGIIIFDRNVTSLSDLAQLVNDAQEAAVGNEPGIPLFVATDQEGWPVLRLRDGGTAFPSNMALGATRSATDAELMASTMAQEMRAVGINMNLAPVMDVNSNPSNPIIGIRSFGSSPELVSHLGTAMIETYQAQDIIATAKHFPGHGDTSQDSHLSLPTVRHDLDRLEAVELAPFRAAISAGVDCIMTAHISLPAVDPTPDRAATLSPPVLQELLREQMGFEGLIATDSLGMRGITDQYDVATAAALAFQAGADLLMFGDDPGHEPSEQRPAYESVLRLVQDGSVPMSKLDDAVRRILFVKAKRELLDWQPVDIDRIPQEAGTPEHLAAARQLAQDSITVLRNDSQLLPLGPESSLMVVYPPGAADLAQAVQGYCPEVHAQQVSITPSSIEIEEVLTQAHNAEVVVLGTLNVQRYPEQAQLVEALGATKSLIAVALGSPYDLLSYPQVSTYVVTYGLAPASMEAVAKVLFGLEAPRGRLPVELPGLHAVGERLRTLP